MAYIYIPKKVSPTLRPQGAPIVNYLSDQARGLIGWWPLNNPDIGRNFSDQRSTPYPPDISRTVGHPNVTLDPILGQMYTDWDTSNYINTGLIARHSEFSVSFWVKLTSVPSTEDRFMGSWDDSPAEGWRIEADQNSQIVFHPKGSPKIVPSHVMDVGGPPVLFTVTQDGTGSGKTGTARVYFNGILDSSVLKNNNLDIGDTRFIFVGCYQDNGNPTRGLVSGDLADVRFYDRALSPLEIWGMYDPISRWDLYWRPNTYIYGMTPSIVQFDIEGSLFTDSDTFNQGDLDLQLSGSLFEDSDTINDGLITVDIEGSILTDADTFNDGEIEFGISGSILEDTDTFFQGDLDLQLFGSLFDEADTFYDADVGGAVTVRGSLFQDADSLNHGRITHLLEGSILTDADTLNHGQVDLRLFGSSIQNTNTFFDADTINVGVRDLEGSLFQDADTLNHGLITIGIGGSLLTDADTFNDGLITHFISGSILEDADTFFDADVSGSLDLQGSLLTDTDSLFHGQFSAGDANIEGSLLTDTDTFNDGLITHFIEGSLLEDADTLNHGLIKIDSDGSLFTNTNTFFDAQLDVLLLEIQGSTLENDNTINNGSLATGLVRGSILTDADTLNHGLITHIIEGSVLTDADTLNHGYLEINITGSTLEDADTLNHGELSLGTINVAGSLLEDLDTISQGSVSLETLRGSILVDVDTLNHGYIEIAIVGSILEDEDIINDGMLGNSNIRGSTVLSETNIFGGVVTDLNTDVTIYRILNVSRVIGGDYTDLCGGVVFASATGAIIGKHEIHTQEDTK